MANEQNLKSFKPGQSGNPAGKPKGIPNTKTRLYRLLTIMQEVDNPITGIREGFTVAEQMDLAQIQQAIKGDTRAYNALVDRLEGKPPQSYELPDSVEVKFEVINRVPQPKEK